MFKGEGKRLIFTIYEGGAVQDISTATNKLFRVKKHLDDTTYIIEKNMEFVTDGTDGKIYVDLTEGDTQDLEGNYIYEIELVIGGLSYVAKVDILTIMKRVES